MADGDIPDSSILVENLKKFIIKYGNELLKPYDSTEELLKKLDRFEYVLLHTPREHKQVVEMLLQPSKEALISNEFIRHSELDVRVSAASCIGEIIRITTPDEPYGDDHMKEFFEVVNSAFESLSFMSGRAYSKAVSILRTMSNCQSCVVMLDLELYATIDRMFHLFLDGIRTSHRNEVFSTIEKIMTIIICNTEDNDQFLLVLVKILLNSLKRENQKASPVSFQLAENTFKNCSDNLKKYRLEAVRCLDVPIEDYAEVVVSFFQDASQRENTEPKETVVDVSCPGIKADVCIETEDNEVKNPKNDESCNENRAVVSQLSVDPDKLGKSIDMQQEQKPEKMHIQSKRNRRPNSLRKAEEGYDPFWMYVDWDSEERHRRKKDKKENTNFPAKTKIPKDSPPKPVGRCSSTSNSSKTEDCEGNKGVLPNNTVQPTSEGVIIVSEDKVRDVTVMYLSDEGQGSSTKVVSEDIEEDAMTKEEALSRGVSEKNPHEIVSHPRTASGSVGEEVVGSRIKVWWPLDQMFYKGTIMGFDHENNTHQVDYDDGDIEMLDLTTECWKLLKKQKKAVNDAAPSSSKAMSGRLKSKRSSKEENAALRTASRSVGEEVVGRRIKVWWPLDQKFYRGRILGFDHKYKMHQVDYDDGEIEILDLTAEQWKLLKIKKETGVAPSSSKAE